MSGGFFRGTSADQDTRFSNKQAKLLKSQKFAPELDQLVDMTKVKMDVLRPWIASRATELLGFEDEVLINFVYGLLEGKAVDGKKIQIQLTGFMEKNTGKFMRELWGLLLSAQMNASGVPQQFLDAKEEEMRKKNVETDRIAQETQKRNPREQDRGKQANMDGEADISRITDALPDPVSKHSLPRDSSIHSEEEREVDFRHGRRSKNRYSKSPHSSKSPRSNDHSPSPRRKSPSATRSSSRSFSKSRSYSEERSKARSVSVSSLSQRHSISPERRYRSPTRRSISPPRRYRSPPRRSISPRRRYSPRNARSPSRKSRRRSGSHPRQRSPSPSRRRSPHARRRSPFLRRRSPSPLRRRSPSPSRRRSPIRRRSSPSRRRSPIRRRFLSPARRRSPFPPRKRSPPRSPKHRRRSPFHSPRNRAAGSQISPRQRKRSRSPHRSRSPSYRMRRSLSRERDNYTNGVESKRYRDDYASHRTLEKRSPLHHASDREVSKRPDSGHKVLDSVSSQLPISLRSPQRDSRDQSDSHTRLPIVPPEQSPNRSESPIHLRKTNSRRNRSSLSGSPVKQIRERMPHYDGPETSREAEQLARDREEARRKTDSLPNTTKDLPTDKADFSPEVYSPDRDMECAEKHVRQVSPSGMEDGPGRVTGDGFSSDDIHDKRLPTKLPARNSSSFGKREFNEQAMKHSDVDGHRINNEKHSHSQKHCEIESLSRPKRKVDNSSPLGAISSDSEEAETYKVSIIEKQRHKKSDKHGKDRETDSESESEIDDKKEVKRRRKEEKKLRKEERRRRREERHQRKLERRASKLKAKSIDTVPLPSDMENNLNDSDDSDVKASTRKDSHPTDTEEPESEQKKLEMELRKKALESLRAKKAISH